MQRLFLPAAQFRADSASILGPDHLHLSRVLRARIGDKVILLDNQGNAFRAALVTIGKTESVAQIEARVELPPEPPIAITVAQALGKSDKFEQVVQHGTEAGASAFLPLRADRCVVDIPTAKVADRLARWRQIAKGAAEQSGRSRIPEVREPGSLTDLCRTASDGEAVVFLLHPAAASIPLAKRVSFLTRPARLIVAVGPEGGWSPAEVEAARAAHLDIVTLGPRILRTETAALIAVSQILFHFEAIS